MIDELKNQNPQTPYHDSPAIFIPIDIVKPRSIEVFVMIFKPEINQKLHDKIQYLRRCVNGASHRGKSLLIVDFVAFAKITQFYSFAHFNILVVLLKLKKNVFQPNFRVIVVIR